MTTASCTTCDNLDADMRHTLKCKGCWNYSLYVPYTRKKRMINPRTKVFKKQVGGTHYKSEGLPKGFPDCAEFCMTHDLGVAEGNVIKYVFRHRNRDGIKDIRKAAQYLEFIAAVQYNETI